MTPPLETPRLLLLPLSFADAGQIQALFPQWEIVRFLADRVPWPYPADAAKIYIRDVALPAAERGEAWHWTLRLKADPDRVIGLISLMKRENENRGFWIDPKFQAKGLMTEAVEAVTEYWFDVLQFPVLRAPKATANEASRCISLKTGMRLVARDERNYVSGRLPSELWEITAEEWRGRHGTK